MKNSIGIATILLATALTHRPAEAKNPAKAVFDVRHELTVKVPDGAKKLRVWFTMPQNDPAQKVRDLEINAPLPHRIEKDSEGNRFIYLEADAPIAKEVALLTTFTLERRETRSGVTASRSRPYKDGELKDKAKYLEPDTNVIIDDRIRGLAKEIVGDETNPVKQARRIYDWVLGNVDYWVKDPKNKKASPVGSTEYCLTSKTGNCTDFHSLWTSLARAAGIPTRMIYGSFLKAELDGQDVDQSYHCWPEFWVPGFGWVPHDVAVADIFVGDFELNSDNETLVRRTTADGYKGKDAEKIAYYFGNIDERRVTWSTGRDLDLVPKQDSGPVNAMAKAWVEVDGKPLPEKEGWVRKLTYRERKPE